MELNCNQPLTYIYAPHLDHQISVQLTISHNDTVICNTSTKLKHKEDTTEITPRELSQEKSLFEMSENLSPSKIARYNYDYIYTVLHNKKHTLCYQLISMATSKN